MIEHLDTALVRELRALRRELPLEPFEQRLREHLQAATEVGFENLDVVMELQALRGAPAQGDFESRLGQRLHAQARGAGPRPRRARTLAAAVAIVLVGAGTMAAQRLPQVAAWLDSLVSSPATESPAPPQPARTAAGRVKDGQPSVAAPRQPPSEPPARPGLAVEVERLELDRSPQPAPGTAAQGSRRVLAAGDATDRKLVVPPARLQLRNAEPPVAPDGSAAAPRARPQQRGANAPPVQRLRLRHPSPAGGDRLRDRATRPGAEHVGHDRLRRLSRDRASQSRRKLGRIPRAERGGTHSPKPKRPPRRHDKRP